MTLAEIKAGLRARASQSVPWTGDALSGSKRGASYAAAAAGTLGVPVYQSGGLLRTASVDIARLLKIELNDDAVTAPATNNQPAETPAPALAVAAPIVPLTAPKPAQTKSRKAPVRKAGAARKASPAAKTKAPHRTRSTVAAE